MSLRTYYWHERVIGPTRLMLRKIFKSKPAKYFAHGNAGDIFAELLLERIYNLPITNIKDDGHRLLCVGSIFHNLKPGDIACGIGVRGTQMPPTAGGVRIWALRGPISYDLAKDAGYDVSHVKFLLDPGLMIRFMAPSLPQPHKPNKIIFIPHYRDRFSYDHLRRRGITPINIDDDPLSLANHILGAKMVYSSSLHGIIFSHALQRPCVFVAPAKESTDFKYQDYYSSIGLAYPRPLSSIDDAHFGRDSDSPADIKYRESDFIFPPIGMLKDMGIIRQGTAESSR